MHIVKRGSFELYLPPYLYPDRAISKRATVAYTDSLHNSMLTIYRDFIPDLSDDSIEITTDEYATYAALGLKDLMPDIALERRDTMHLNSYETIAMTFSGTFDSKPVWYCLTVVRTDDYFFQLSAWTLEQYADTKGRDLYYAITTFRAYR